MPKPCAVVGCDRTARARGWCSGHYDRWRLGRPLGEGPALREPPTHGLASTYSNLRCRCEDCRRANSDRMQQQRRERRRYPSDQIPHGRGGYSNYDCRCKTCKEANAAFLTSEIARRRNSSDIPHGTASGFRFWGCRCEACHAANAKNQRRRQCNVEAKVREKAHRNGYTWTGPELEIIDRQDLNDRQKALMIGRTIHAVRHMRRLLQDQPTGKYRRLLEGRVN